MTTQQDLTREAEAADESIRSVLRTRGPARSGDSMRAVSVALLASALLVACGGSDDASEPGRIQRLEIVSTADAYGGATPAGAAGPYTVISAIAHGKLNPRHANNAGIVDLDKAPVGNDGLVSYSTDVVILRPEDRGNRETGAFL